MAVMETMDITLNGESQQIPAGFSVASLLAHLQLPADRLAVEMNKVIVRKRDWPDTSVPPGAQLEIVEFVGGG